MLTFCSRCLGHCIEKTTPRVGIPVATSGAQSTMLQVEVPLSVKHLMLAKDIEFDQAESLWSQPYKLRLDTPVNPSPAHDYHGRTRLWGEGRARIYGRV